jgi:two-component system, sensor histidine kinase and response regulator
MSDRLSLLLADDEAIIRKKVYMMLGDKFRIDEASSAASAREAALGNYDAVLLDVMFPDGNGIEICSEIKKRDPHATVIISSSMETVAAWNDAFNAGADGYLEKRELLGLDPRKITLTITNLVERNRLRRQAEDLTRRQTELLSVLSHDVRAPFQALLGTIEMLRKSPIPQECVQNVDNLYDCAKDQLAFINSLLEILRLESGSSSIRRTALDVNLPVSASLQNMTFLASSKEILLQADLQRGLPKIYGDIARIAQLMNNLVTNAIKFTPRNGRVSVGTALVEKKGISGVEISVEDTGVGVCPEDRLKIFQRFHRGRDKGTEGEKGIGLGLCICKEIMQLHGGIIEVEDAPAKGALFKAWFPTEAPVSPSEENSRAADESRSKTAEYRTTSSPGRIDEPAPNMLIKNGMQPTENLRENGFQRRCATRDGSRKAPANRRSGSRQPLTTQSKAQK